MLSSKDKALIEKGIRVADSKIYQQDKIWSKYSNDKVSIGEQLAKVIRTLNKALPLTVLMRALSIGSSSEPQFRILETAFRGGLFLVDIEKEALDIVKERVQRQYTKHVSTILRDYTKAFLNKKSTLGFYKKWLKQKKVNLVTFHHSLYYCNESSWHTIVENLYRYVLSNTGAMHLVLMAAKSQNPYTTTWLYNHFVGKYFGLRNNQDLRVFGRELKKIPVYKNAQVILRTNKVYFSVNDFEEFMSVIWMILLYPDVHEYSFRQKEEITEHIFKNFWKNNKPLIQQQDHLAIYRGIPFKGIL